MFVWVWKFCLWRDEEINDPAIGSAFVEDDYAAMAVAIIGMKHAEWTKKELQVNFGGVRVLKL